MDELSFPIPDFKKFSLRDRKYSINYISKHYPEFFEYLSERYPGFQYKEQLYMFIHNMDEPRRCPVCGNYTKLQDLKYGFREYCSPKCCNSCESKKEKTANNNIAKYGCKNPSSLPDVKRQVRDTMNKMLEEDPEMYKKHEEKRKKTKLIRYGDENYVGHDKFVQTMLERYGVEHPSQLQEVKEKKKQTLLKHYGVDHQSKSEEIKRKKIETSLKHYGVEHPSQLEEIKIKVKQTNLERYGFETASQNDEVKAKYKSTMIERYGENYVDELTRRREESCLRKYGVTNVMKLPEFVEKAKKTSLERYGVDSPLKNKGVRDRIKMTCLERYGVENPYLIHANKDTQDSVPNKNFMELLETAGIIYSREVPLIKYRYDFMVDKTLIELDPSPTHNSTWGVFGNPPKSETYHREKSELAEQNGFHCIHVWDWDNPEKVVNMLKPRQKVYARTCEIVEINQKQANQFLEEHHLQGGCKGQKICLSLQKDGEILEVMTFGHPRYNHKVQHELLRLCTKTGITVIGGTEKLFKHFVEKYNPESIVSYCDMSKFSGDIYTRLGFKISKKPQPSKHWFNLRTGQHVTDGLLRQRGYDQLFKTNYGKGTSNEQLMLEAGFVEVFDCGQSTYIWKNAA